MAIVQTLTTSFKQELLQAIHNFSTDTFYIALYNGNADLGAGTTVYTTSNELPNGSGYTRPGLALTGVAVVVSGTTVYVSFSNATWTGASFTARGALIYNQTKANRAVAVLNFGADKIANPVTQTFVVQMPLATPTTALIRIP